MSGGPRRSPAPAFERVVVGFDGSAPSVRAARVAMALAQAGGGRLWLVHARSPDPRLAEPLTEEEATAPADAVGRAMATLVEEAVAAGLAAEALTREGSPAAVLLAAARDLSAGAIVVGTRGLGGAARLLLGSVSARVVAEATVPVTVVP